MASLGFLNLRVEESRHGALYPGMRDRRIVSLGFLNLRMSNGDMVSLELFKMGIERCRHAVNHCRS